MRVLLGLAALAVVNAQTATPSGSTTAASAQYPPIGQTALSTIGVTGLSNGVSTGTLTVTPTGFGINSGTNVNSNNFAIIVPFATDSIVFQFNTNIYTGQMQYRWSPGYTSPATMYPTATFLSSQSYTCDPCSGGTAVSCETSTGPGAGNSPKTGFSCSQLSRTYTLSNLRASTQVQQIVNSFSVQLFDIITTPAPNVSSYSFQIVRQPSPIVGDPQIVGLQGQDFQVHGIPDEIFNLVTYPNLQVNARFVYLSAAECHDNFTACFAHPGTYISEEGIRLGKDKIHVTAGSFKKGLTVSVNGQKVTGKVTKVKLGSVEVVNHRRVVVKTPIMALTISNSDNFLNQETALFDEKLLALGAERRTLLVGESFHPEVPLHGLQGQTWRNVEYPSGLEYEGSISDYHVTDGNLFGSKFVFNQFKH